MATIINNPGERTDSGSGVGVVVGVILAVILALLLLLYGIPGLRGTETVPNNNPDTNPSLDVNINGGTGAGGPGAVENQ